MADAIPEEIRNAWASYIDPDSWEQVGFGEEPEFRAPHSRNPEWLVLAVYRDGHVANSHLRREHLTDFHKVEQAFTALHRTVRGWCGLPPAE